MQLPFQTFSGQPFFNNRKAFDALFGHLYAPLVQFARRIVHDRQAAEDIVTEVFIKLWQRQVHFPSIQSARSFLYISTRNACFNHLEHTQYQNKVKDVLLHTLEDKQESVLNDITRAEVLRQIFHLVHELPAQCRRVLLLSFTQGLTNKQIALKMKLSVHTVRNHKVRGMRMIRKKLKSSLH